MFNNILTFIFYRNNAISTYSSTNKDINNSIVITDPIYDLSLVIPAYNEEYRLPIMLDSTLDFLSNWPRITSYEVYIAIYIHVLN